MKAAFSIWDNRIAPVFDVARQIRLVEAESGRILGETLETLEGDIPMPKAHRLAELGAGELVCGAISRPLQAMVAAYGIRVIAFVAGDLREVIEAWLHNRLESDLYAMPGCCGRGGRRFRGTPMPVQEEGPFMNSKKSAGQGRGGKGLGQRGQTVAARPHQETT